MDRIIKRYNYRRDADLNITDRGVAYSRQMRATIKYDQEYFRKCKYKESEISEIVNKSRVDFVNAYIGPSNDLLDIGIGAGNFIKTRGKHTFGNDINPSAVIWLKQNGIYSTDYRFYKAFSFWDVIEHLPKPEEYFKKIEKDSYLFASIPIFDNLNEIRKSKHYRPKEHLYYFTFDGFINYMFSHGFGFLESTKAEIKAGRENIIQFVFKKNLPAFHDNIVQYKKIYSNYGDSSHLYFKQISKLIIKNNPSSILDYGCGQSDLVSYFWNDGKRKIYRFDPAIPKYKILPEFEVDLIICNDVLEHIAVANIDYILNEIKNRGKKVIFTISLKIARAILPDGRNAHITILKKDEWIRWLKEYFPEIREANSGYDNILFLTDYS